MAVYCDPSILPSTKRVLVCGGRDFSDAAWLARILDHLHDASPFELLIHGGARGADTLAGNWAKARGVPVQVFRADWDKHGKVAGILRNKQMLEEGKPSLVVGFPGGRGTADMMRRTAEAGVDWLRVSRDSDTRPKDGDAQQGSARE
jgi:hypothetical protein